MQAIVSNISTGDFLKIGTIIFSAGVLWTRTSDNTKAIKELAADVKRLLILTAKISPTESEE